MKRFSILAPRALIGSGHYAPDEEGVPQQICTSSRTAIYIVDSKRIYSNKKDDNRNEGICMEIFDMELAEIVCNMLNNRDEFKKTVAKKAFHPQDNKL